MRDWELKGVSYLEVVVDELEEKLWLLGIYEEFVLFICSLGCLICSYC